MACLGKFSIETSEMPCSHLCAGRTYYNKDIKLMMKQTAFLYFQDKGLLAQAQIDNQKPTSKIFKKTYFCKSKLKQ